MLTRRSQARFEISDGRRVSWYAALFNVPTFITEQDETGKLVRYQEFISPDAFTEALASGAEVIANIDHDPVQTFATRNSGKLLLQSDPKGLYCSCWIPETPEGDTILERVQRGELDGASFQFFPVEDRNHGGNVIERVKVKLYDVCLTANPAYGATKGEVHLRSNNRLRYLMAKYRYLRIKNSNHHTT